MYIKRTEDAYKQDIKTVLIAFREKTNDIVKLNTLQGLDTIAMRTLYPPDDFILISYNI